MHWLSLCLVALGRSVPVEVTIEGSCNFCCINKIKFIFIVPSLTVSEERVPVLVGDNVTVACMPTDNSYFVEWLYVYDTGSISIPPTREGR